MAGNHAIIAPSSLALTVACQAWVQLAAPLPPEPDTPETLEGNAADWVAKQYAQGVEVPYGTPTPVPGYTVDWDMIHGAKMWRDVIGPDSVSGVPVVCERIHPTDCWGEPDGWKWIPETNTLRLPDYKYGFMVVDVFECWQLIGYAAGLIDTLGVDELTAWVEFIIVQPRAFHRDGPVRTWRVRARDLRGLINQANAAALIAWPTPDQRAIHGDGIPDAKAGEHCLYCPARSVCQTFQQAVTKVVEFVGRGQSIALDANAVGVELAILHAASVLLKGRVQSLEQQAESYLRAGHRVPNYMMESGSSHLKWNEGVTADEVIGLGSVLGKDLKRPPGDINARGGPVVTPTQAIKAGVDKDVVGCYASRPPAAMTLAKCDTDQARRVFGGTPST